LKSFVKDLDYNEAFQFAAMNPYLLDEAKLKERQDYIRSEIYEQKVRQLQIE